MVNTRRTDMGNGSQQRPNGSPQLVSNAEMLRQVYELTLSMDRRVRRLEENGRASRGNDSHTEELHMEGEEESNGQAGGPSVHSEDFGESTKQNHAPDMFTVWKQLDRFHPKTFSGGSPTEASAWIDRLEMLFDSIVCDSYQRVLAAKTLLADGALDWWNTVKPVDGRQLDWNEFKIMFFDFYFPIEMRHQKEAEFFTLQQREMDENTFIARFMELSKYVSQLDRAKVTHNHWLARQLLEKCNDNVKLWLGAYDVTTLEKLIAKIREVCRRHRDAAASMRRDFNGRFSGHIGPTGHSSYLMPKCYGRCMN